MKSITFSADEKSIEAARRKAHSKQTTLNEEFRKWLSEYTDGEDDYATRALALIEELRKTHTTGGRKFTRDEMNER